MKTILIILAVVALSACSKRAETSTSVGADFVVDRLFTHEGCTVYRFSDGGHSRYFTNCSGSATWRENCGKNCNREMNVN